MLILKLKLETEFEHAIKVNKHFEHKLSMYYSNASVRSTFLEYCVAQMILLVYKRVILKE
jgi:hypothetical protein